MFYRPKFGVRNGFIISYQQAWRTREALRTELEGDEAECFRKLLAMLSVIDDHDNRNHVAIEARDGWFYRGVVIPGAIRAAYETCRPFIALDGCRTKSRFRITLLVACTLDGNNEILPLTWAIIPIEDGGNWTWFLGYMKDWFYRMDVEEVVIISDRDKGLQSAVLEVFPNAHHSRCCQHLADNVQKHFGLPARNAFWKAAYVWNEHNFIEAISAIKEVSAPAAEYINSISHKTWAQYVFSAA